MRLCWGHCKKDLVKNCFKLSEVSLQAAISARRASFHSVFLQFGENLFYNISNDSEAVMAAKMVFLFETKSFDSDGWIAEAQKMEEETERVLASEDSDIESEEEEICTLVEDYLKH